MRATKHLGGCKKNLRGAAKILGDGKHFWGIKNLRGRAVINFVGEGSQRPAKHFWGEAGMGSGGSGEKNPIFRHG